MKNLIHPILYSRHIGLLLLSILLLSLSCVNRGDDDSLLPPVISLEGGSAIFTTKIGQTITITPTVENGEGAAYSWTIDGEEICSDSSYSGSFDANGSVYLSLMVENSAGSDSVDMRIDVSPLSLPVISLLLPESGVVLLCGASYLFEPEITNQDVDGFECRWSVDGSVVSQDLNYNFVQSEVGEYEISLQASNDDGDAAPFEFTVSVVESLPYDVSFATHTYIYTEACRSTLVGRPVFIDAIAEGYSEPQYRWSVDGEVVESGTASQFSFTPSQGGEFEVEVTVSEDGVGEASATMVVYCASGSQQDYMRASTAQSSSMQNAVYEFIPAPGQYVGEATFAYTGAELTHQAAIEYAEGRLSDGSIISLGGFGGYIVVGFDHSIVNREGDYDFAIYGNAFDGGSEPGVVCVMQDLNGNGLPDDQWYELRGSESDVATTLTNYSVTYYRPSASSQSVSWVDSLGESGTIDYYGAYHSQDYYYPLWIESDIYTLSGTRLEARNVQESTTSWDNQSYPWGYADNFGDDLLTEDDSLDGSNQANAFKIENAMFSDGSAVELTHIDFIKVQVAVNAKSGLLGELSTEVSKFVDLSVD